MGKFSKALDKVDSLKGGGADRDSKIADEVASGETGGRRPSAQKPVVKAVRKSSSGSWDERLSRATMVTGPAAESFRTLRSRILHPNSGIVPKSLLVTSAVPGEGKTFVCANLGVVLAQGSDQYCLMVDCDLRKPALHRLFGLPIHQGLANYLRDGDDLTPMIMSAGIETLSLLPAGPPPVNPAELLGSERMARLVEELEKRYDDRIILLDSPPMQAASETAVLARQVDGVILVVRWGGSRRENLYKLVELIGPDRIVGVVFNAFETNILDKKLFGSYEYYAYAETS